MKQMLYLYYNIKSTHNVLLIQQWGTKEVHKSIKRIISNMFDVFNNYSLTRKDW